MTSASDDWPLLGHDICLSGGADGADLQFGMCAGSVGHRVFHFIFEGHRSKAPEVEKVVLSQEQLLVADPALKRANKTLRRKWPVHNRFTACLLRRNYYQVVDADAVYAAAAIDDDGLVTGGTAWAVQMFLDRFESDKRAAYVFDQNLNGWFEWDCGWEPLDMPPPPAGIYAGIGSRKLQRNGKDAIRDLFGYSAEIVQPLQ